MDARTFSVLAAEDQHLVDGLAVATSRPAARVLAYLLWRTGDSELTAGASRRVIGIEAGEHERSVSKALEVLRSADLITKTTTKTDGSGRPLERAVDRFDGTETVHRRGWGWHTPDGWASVQTMLSKVESQP